MTSLEKVKSLAEELSADVNENEPMSKHTTFRIGGAADLFIVPHSEKTFSAISAFCQENNIPCMTVGNGSNLLVSDKGIRGVVLKSSDDAKITVDGEKITAPAGINLSVVCEAARKNSLTGLEFAYGIPGSVGGAVYMNAGAYGGEMKDVVSSVKFVSGKNICELSKDQLAFSYRSSAFTGKNLPIAEAEFTLKKGNPDEITQRMKDLLNRRKTKQPLDFPSAGSVFKRPEGHFAGALIEQCELKGAKVGGAMVSEKHAGFIINAGGATCEDVLLLVKKIQSVVYEKTGVTLECEIKAVGEF